MATKVKPRKKKGPTGFDDAVPKTDWERLAEHIKENPILYAACTAFVLVAIVAGMLFRVNADARAQAEITEFARAMESEDPVLRALELEPLAQGAGPTAAKALYMKAEAAYEGKKYGAAKQAFERLRRDFPDSPFLPDAVEGLGFLAENEEQYESALASYGEIIEKWPGSFTRRRQELNIARCQERIGDFGAAVKAYEAQVDQFPGSAVAGAAEAALARLRRTNPEVFAEEEKQAADETTQTDKATEAEAAEATEAETKPAQAVLDPTTAPEADAEPAVEVSDAADTAQPSEPDPESAAPPEPVPEPTSAETEQAVEGSQPAVEQTEEDSAAAPSPDASLPETSETPAQ